MRDAIIFVGAFVIYYVGLFVTAVVAFVILALLVRWVCPCRNCRARRGRSTPPSPQHAAATARCAKDSSVRVGRPEPLFVIARATADGEPEIFDVAWRENWHDWGELAVNLSDGGDALRKEGTQ